MRIFKFGGASVKDAEGVRNLLRVLRETGTEKTFLVVSAMGKMTNALEAAVDAYFEDKDGLIPALEAVESFHLEILRDLFPSERHPVYREVRKLFEEVRGFLAWNKSPKYAFVYDQVVGYGELLSTTIISQYLEGERIENTLLDIRRCIKTDANYRDVRVDWTKTQKEIAALNGSSKFYVTQGFLGSDDNNFTTTLGREGSDYTAAIIAFCLNAESVTIWKDVPGVLNADPRYFEKPRLLNRISYREAIELAFYGATVIHPKTLQPLQRKEIPLYVKSFLNPSNPGTEVGKGIALEPKIPCFILKKNQVLMKLSSLDFSFIVEENISEIFRLLHNYKMKVDLIQNSAISFSVCFDNRFGQLPELLQHLKGKYRVKHHEGVSLYTVRHFDSKAIASLLNGRDVLLEQRSKETVQLVIKT
ncbi:aspartate kinase [Robiginitalea sp.]|uniref:aspartate kinase n=1 Tax=Robiginitalea sp. TaxID=1902411 RepID=UPI003C73B12D